MQTVDWGKQSLKNFLFMSSTIDLPLPIIEWSNYIVIGLLSLDRSCTSQWPPALGASRAPHQTTLHVTCVVKGRIRPRRV